MSKVKWIKEVLKFLVGFQTAHVIGHIALLFSNTLPFTVNLGLFEIRFTERFNSVAIVYNFFILGLLIYFAYLRESKNRI